MPPSEPLSARQISHVFRQLSEEHAGQREASSREVAWRLLQARRLGAREQPRRFIWAAAAAAALAVLSVSLWFITRDSPLEYGVVGARVENGLVRTRAEAATLAFSDESVIEVDPDSTVSVAVQGAHRAQARLSQGRLRVKVKHSADTDWRFVAGPHEIRVVGTRFDVEWQPQAGRFSLVMHEGRVLLTGGERPAATLSAGQIVVIEPPPSKAEALAAKSSAPASAAGSTPEPARSVPAARSVEASWPALVARGDFAEVVRAAERLGISTVLRERDAAELRALAQAARYTGQSALAVRTWKALRSRFSGDARAQAAFFLGRTYEAEGKTALAIQSYDDYLGESPSGVYAAEALGRKLAMLARLDDARARAVAREYLRRFPQGSYARTARDILASE